MSISLMILFDVSAQKTITLNKLITFSNFTSRKNFYDLIKNDEYTLFNSNLVKSFTYDELGWVKKTKLKKFKRLQNGDSILFNKHFKVIGKSKSKKPVFSHLSFYKLRDTLLIKNTTSAQIAGYNYIEELHQDCIDQAFVRVSADTVFNENETIINHVFRKKGYQLTSSVIQKKLREGSKSLSGELKKYQINFIKTDTSL
jgi:hypothetical protein